MRIAFKVGFPGKYSMLVSFTEKTFKFVINILIQLSHTKNRLVKMRASCCKYMLIFSDLWLSAQFDNKIQLLNFIS